MSPMTVEDLRAALSRLADAAEAAMSSDDDMPSHEGTMTEFDDALDAARALLFENPIGGGST